MKIFTDSAGRTWTISITVDAIKRVRDLVGVNLADVTEGESSGGPLMTRLATDIVLLCDVIYAIVKPQADQRADGRVSDEQFGQALGGDVIQAAHDAFWEALADFFRQLRRTDQVRAIEKQQKLIGAAVAAADRRIDQIQIDRLIDEAMHEGEPPPRWLESRTEDRGAVAGTSGGGATSGGGGGGGSLSGSSPDSSPSTPAR